MHAEWEQRCGGELDTDMQNAHFKIICQSLFWKSKNLNPKLLVVPVTFLVLSTVLNISISQHNTAVYSTVFLIHLHWKWYDKRLCFVRRWLITTDRENPRKVKEAFRKISTCDSCPVSYLITPIRVSLFLQLHWVTNDPFHIPRLDLPTCFTMKSIVNYIHLDLKDGIKYHLIMVLNAAKAPIRNDFPKSVWW